MAAFNTAKPPVVGDKKISCFLERDRSLFQVVSPIVP